MSTFSRGAYTPYITLTQTSTPYPPINFSTNTDFVAYPPTIATAAGLYGTAVGKNASASAAGATAIGAGSQATSAEAVAVGGDDTSSTSNAANALADGTVAIGNNSLADDPYNIAVGMNAVCTDASNLGGGIALGAGALVSNTEAIAIGGGQNATNASVASGLRSIAIGTYATASGQNSIAIGSGSSSETTTATTSAIAIGNNSNAGAFSVAIGNGGASGTEANGINAISILGQNKTNGTGTVSIGFITTCLAPNYVVGIGSRFQCDSYGGIAIGGASSSSTTTAIIVSTSYYGIAIGQGARATTGPGSGAIAFGAAAKAGGTRSIAIGGDPTANSGLTTGVVLANELGGTVENSRAFAIAIGGRCKASVGNSALALGYQTTASAASAVSIGPGNPNSVATSVALGSTSELVKFHLSTTGGFHNRSVKNTSSSTTPTLTTTQVLGQYFTLTDTTAVTVTLPSSTDLDADLQLAGNLYVGLSFTLFLGAGSGTTTIAITLGADQIAYGLTSAGGAGESRTLMFYRTGPATYDVFIQ